MILLFAISLFVAELAFDSSHLNAQKSALLATGVTLVLIVFLLLTLAGDNVSRKYYTVAEGTVAGVCLLLVVYGGLREQSN